MRCLFSNVLCLEHWRQESLVCPTKLPTVMWLIIGRAHYLSASPVLLRSSQHRRRCWERSGSWRRRGRSLHRFDSSSTSSFPRSWGRTRADLCAHARAAQMKAPVSRGAVADGATALLSCNRGIYSTWNRPVWWEKQVPVSCSFVCVWKCVCVAVNAIDLQRSIWRRLLKLSL